MKDLFLIDGNSLLFRAFYATSYPGSTILRTKDGTPTNAINAFANMMNRILDMLPIGEGLVVAFDTGKKTFRHEQFTEYKAQRKEGPEELFIQMPIARALLQNMGILTLELDGYEGDDIIGTLADKASKMGINVHIFTSDRDFLQLINDNTKIHILKSGLKDIKTYQNNEVLEEYGINANQMIDYKALCGDASDNYKGVPGIGPKKAQQLLNTYGTFENIIANASSIGGKFETVLIDNQKDGEMCKYLATICLTVPIEATIEESLYKGFDVESLSIFLGKLEMFSFISRVNRKHNEDESNRRRPSLTWNVIETTENIDLGKEFVILPDIDFKTYHQSVIRGFVLATSDGLFYISNSDSLSDSKLREALENPAIAKSTFDLKALSYTLLRNGIEIKGQLFDSLLAHYLLDSGSNRQMSAVFLPYKVLLDDEPSFEDVSRVEYLFSVAEAIKKTKEAMSRRIIEEGMEYLLQFIETPLSVTLSKMEFEGFPLNKAVLNDFKDEYEGKLSQITSDIHALSGHSFNISSPKQVGEVIFDELKLSENKKRSTASDHLKHLSAEHPIIDLILEHRKYSKLLSTYIESLSEHIKDDGKIHTTYNQTLTTTGRLSSQEPNMQNITIRDEEGRQIRKAFYYSNDEYRILSLDYSNVELRILASLAQCDTLIEAFKNGLDIHTETAKRIYDTPNPSLNERRNAKAVTFGIVYGISDWGLSDQLQISVPEARLIINQFYEAYPEIALYLNQIAIFAQEKGFVETMFNRRRYLREIHDSNYNVRENARRAALNAPIQGSAADIIKIAMVKLDLFLRENKYETRMVLQIHDELIFKIPKSEIGVVEKQIKNIMENTTKIEAKLEVGGGLGKTWFEAK